MTTLQKIQKIFAKEFSVPEESVKPEASLESLGIDSLGSIEVLFEVEDEFHIRFPQGRVEEMKINTVQDILDIIDRLVAEQQPGQPGEGQKS